MNSVISYLIERELLSGNVVELPGVGELWVERSSAILSGDMSSMTPPVEHLAFRCESQCGGVVVGSGGYGSQDSFYRIISSHLQESSNVGGYFDSEEFDTKARVGYAEWLATCVVSDMSGIQTLTIDGVCEVSMSLPRCLTGVYESFLSLICSTQEQIYIGTPIFAAPPSVPPQSQPYPHQSPQGSGVYFSRQYSQQGSPQPQRQGHQGGQGHQGQGSQVGHFPPPSPSPSQQQNRRSRAGQRPQQGGRPPLVPISRVSSVGVWLSVVMLILAIGFMTYWFLR